ncbi:hypothetical protein ACIRL2_43895 [Embleya sp. NPDC127516]
MFPRLRAAWLLLDPARPGWERDLPAAGVVSYGSASRVHGLGDLPGPGPEFTLPPGTSVPEPAESRTTVHVAGLAPTEWQLVDGLPVTTPARTLRDLASVSTVDQDTLGRVASSIVRRKSRDARGTGRGARRAPGRKGRDADGRRWLRFLHAPREPNGVARHMDYGNVDEATHIHRDDFRAEFPTWDRFRGFVESWARYPEFGWDRAAHQVLSADLAQRPAATGENVACATRGGLTMRGRTATRDRRSAPRRDRDAADLPGDLLGNSSDLGHATPSRTCGTPG